VTRIAVQVYEIQDPQEAEAVVSLGVDRVGSVIVSEDTWRVQSIKDAVLVSKEATAKHSIITLFSNVESLFRVIEFYEPDILHFCEVLVCENSSETPWESLVDIQAKIKDRYPQLEIMRSIPISTAKSPRQVPSLEIANRFKDVSDSFLTDTWLGKEPVEGFVGITGQTCDWDAARKLVESSTIPVIVAGGLSPDNVYDAIMATRTTGVDSCTKTNKQDGKGKPIRFKKDLQKVKRFVEEVRRAEGDFDCTKK